MWLVDVTLSILMFSNQTPYLTSLSFLTIFRKMPSPNCNHILAYHLERFCDLKTDEKRHNQKITPLCHIDSVMPNLTSGLTFTRNDKTGLLCGIESCRKGLKMLQNYLGSNSYSLLLLFLR